MQGIGDASGLSGRDEGGSWREVAPIATKAMPGKFHPDHKKTPPSQNRQRENEGVARVSGKNNRRKTANIGFP